MYLKYRFRTNRTYIVCSGQYRTICLGAASLTSTAIITARKKLEFEKNALEYLEHVGKYSEIHISIRAELVLLRMHDSAFAINTTDFMKTVEHEIDA